MNKIPAQHMLVVIDILNVLLYGKMHISKFNCSLKNKIPKQIQTAIAFEQPTK